MCIIKILSKKIFIIKKLLSDPLFINFSIIITINLIIVDHHKLRKAAPRLAIIINKRN